MRNFNFLTIVLATILLSLQIRANKFDVYDFTKDYNQELSNIYIKNDTLFSISHSKNNILIFDFENLSFIPYPDDMKIRGFIENNNKIIASTDKNIFIFDGNEWNLFDQNFKGYSTENILSNSSFIYNITNDEIFCTISYTGIFNIKNNTIEMHEFDDQNEKLRFLPGLEPNNSFY